jgi:hypothetical protein
MGNAGICRKYQVLAKGPCMRLFSWRSPDEGVKPSGLKERRVLPVAGPRTRDLPAKVYKVYCASRLVLGVLKLVQDVSRPARQRDDGA